MDQRDDHIDEEDEDDPIKLLDVKNRKNIWFESNEHHMLCDEIKSEEIQEELKDDIHNIDLCIFKPVTKNLPLSLYSNSENVHLIQNCHNYTIPTVNCDRYKKINVNGDTSYFSDNTGSMVDIKEEVVEEVVNDFDSNVILRNDEIDKTANEKRNVLGSIKKDTSVSKPNRELILSEKKSMVIDCRKNKGLVGIKVKQCVSNKESSKLGSGKKKGLVGRKVKEHVSKINNKQISKQEAKNINVTTEFDRLNTNFTTDDCGTIGASVNKINDSNVEDELDMIKLPDQTSISKNKTENYRVLIMLEKENNKSNRILTHQQELLRHNSTYITPSSFTDNSTRKKTCTKSRDINKNDNKKRSNKNFIDTVKYRHSINKINKKTMIKILNKKEVCTKLKATFDEMNGIEKGIETTTNKTQSIDKKLKIIEAKNPEEEIMTLSKTCDKNVSKGLELQCLDIGTILKNKSMIFDNSKLTLFKDNINFNKNSSFIVDNMKSNTEKLNNPPNDFINERITMYKAVERDKIQHSTNNNGERVLEQKISCPNVVNTNYDKSIESKYEFSTRNILMHTEREVDVVNNNSNKRQVVNNEWKSTGDADKIYHKLGLTIQNQTVTKRTVKKSNQLRETTQINIDTNIHGKHGVYKKNMDAIDNSVNNYQFTNSQSAVESSRSLKEIQTPVFASGIGSEIKNKAMDQKILIAKNLGHDNKKLVTRFQNKKKGNKRLISENSQKICSNMHIQNFDNVPTNSNATAPRSCRFNTDHLTPNIVDLTECTLNTEHHHLGKGAAILKQRNELIRIQNNQMRNRAVGNSGAADNVIPQNTNSVDNDLTYSLMRNSLLNYNTNIQKGLDQRLNAQRQSYDINAAKNEIPRKVNAMKNYIPNCSRMRNRHANYNYNSNITQLTQINSTNSSKKIYNQNSTDNVVPQFQSTHLPQYRNLSNTKPRGFNDNYCPVNLHPSFYNSPYIQDLDGNYFSDPKIPMIRTPCNNIRQNYVSQYDPMENLMPYDSHSSISHRNDYNMPLNLSSFQLPDISLQTPHFIDFSKPSPLVAPLMQSPISLLVPPLAKERVRTSVQLPVFPSMTMLSPVQAQPPVQAPKSQVVQYQHQNQQQKHQYQHQQQNQY